MSHEREYGDAIDARGSHGFINRPAGSVHQHYHGDVAHNVQGLANPYLGLAAFTYAERDRYAGRETQISAALAKLTTPGAPQVLLFVTGASGSGKSSFAQAGLLPALEAYYAQRHQTVRSAVFRPSQQPLVQLADAFQQLGLPVPQLENPPPLTWRLTHTPTNVVNVIIIDQFEELFTQSQPAQRAVLCDWLSNLPPFADLRTHLIATLRADYLPELFAHQTLWGHWDANNVDLRAMTATELRTAIQQPLHAWHPDAGKHFEDALLDHLTTDAMQDATYLPLLQVTLAQLWEGGLLKLARYGTLTDAIQDQAEQVYAETSNQDALMAILLDLVEVSLDDDARRDVRRRRTQADLTQTDPERGTLIETLCQARLLSADVEHHADQDVEVVDIIHESLLTNWPRLREAITTQRERLQRRARFEHWLRDWEHHHRADAYLLDGVRLSEAEELAAQRDVALQGTAAQALLTRSLTQREAKSRRRLRIATGVAGVLAILLLIAVGAGVIAFQQQQIASDNASEADRQREQAETNAAEADRQREQAETNAAEADRQREQAEANAAEARESLALTLATTASTWPDDDEAFVLALAAVRLDEYMVQIHDLASDAIKQYPLQNAYLSYDGAVTSVAYSPDGGIVLSGSNDGTVRLWEVMTRETLRVFEGHTDWVTSIAFSPDGTTILSGANDDTMRLWDIETGEMLQTFEGHERGVTSVAYSPDGRTVFSGSFDGTLRLWEVSTGGVLRTFDGHDDEVTSVAFSPDGATVLSGSFDGTLRLWEVATGRVFRIFSVQDSEIRDVAYSPDGAMVLSGGCGTRNGDDCVEGELQLWDVATGTVVQTFEGHTDSVTSVAFSPDGAVVLSGGCGTRDGDDCVEGELQLWDVTTGEVLRTFEGHDGGVRSVAFSPDGAMVLSGGCGTRTIYSCREGELRLWDVTAGEVLRIFEGQKWVTSVTYSPNGEKVLSGSGYATLYMWDVKTGEVLYIFEGHMGSVRGVAYSPDGAIVLSGGCSKNDGYSCSGSEGELQLWDVTTREVLRTFEGHANWVNSVAYSPDGTTVLSGSSDGTLWLWDASTGTVLRTFEGHNREVTSVAYSPDGENVLSGSGDRTLRLWEVRTGKVLQTFEGHAYRVLSVAYSPNGQTVLSGSDDGTLRLWDVRTGMVLRTFAGHMDQVTSVAYSPDGATVLSGSEDGTMRLWDVGTGEVLRTFKVNEGWVTSVAYSPDGLTIISSSCNATDFDDLGYCGKGELQLWDARPLTEIACTERYIVPEAEAAIREQFGIPDDLVLCPEE